MVVFRTLAIFLFQCNNLEIQMLQLQLCPEYLAICTSKKCCRYV